MFSITHGHPCIVTTVLPTSLKLADLCRTRWVARHNALSTFLELYEAAVAMFEAISDNENRSWNPDSPSKAAALVRSIIDFRFIVTFSVV